MGRIIEDFENVMAPDDDYIYGRILDKIPGEQSGTPVNEQTYGDIHQFFARLLALAGINSNGLPDNDYNGFQFMDAFLKLVRENPEADIQSVLLPATFQNFDLAYQDITGMTLTTPDDGITRVYDVMVGLDCSRGVGANDIGAYFKVIHGSTDIKETLTRVAAGSPHDVCVTFFAGKITIPPNTIVKVQQKCVNGATSEPIIETVNCILDK